MGAFTALANRSTLIRCAAGSDACNVVRMPVFSSSSRIPHCELNFDMLCPPLTISTPFICRGAFQASARPLLLEVHMATAGGKRNQASYFVDLCLQVLCAASCIPQLSRQHERVFASRQNFCKAASKRFPEMPLVDRGCSSRASANLRRSGK